MSGKIIQKNKCVAIALFMAMVLSTSSCISVSRVSSLDDLAQKISGKILLSSSDGIIIVDLYKKDISYLGKDHAGYPKWGPAAGTLTYFQHRLKKGWGSIDSKDVGDIKISNSDGTERILVSDIPIFDFEGFAWSNDKKNFAYIAEKGQLSIISNTSNSLEKVNLLISSPEKLAYTKHPIFSLDDKNIIFLGVIENDNPPLPTGIYEFNRKDKTMRKIKQESDILGIALSPDGKKLAYISDKGLYILDRETGSDKRLIEVPMAEYSFCSWSPDGSKILYGYPRGFWKMKDPQPEVHMIDINTKAETILIDKRLLQQEINIRELRCHNVDWVN